jgi:hypothetical protein
MPEQQQKSTRERIQELTDGIDRGIREMFGSGRYKEFLTVMSRFNRYSLNNSMLIFMQKPDAVRVASYDNWKNKYGRGVVRGEKGITIIAPAPYRKVVDTPKLDPKTGRPVDGTDGKAVTVQREVTVPAYKPTVVFDQSQTEGRLFPEAEPYSYGLLLDALRRSPFASTEIAGNGLSEVQMVSDCIHGMAQNALSIKGRAEKDELTRQIEVESVAYAVCQYYGIETDEASFERVAAWAEGKELPELRASLGEINRASSRLIGSIERDIRELKAEREALLATEGYYLHIQQSDEGWDYTLYGKDSLKLLDGGRLDAPELRLSEAAQQLCEDMGISGPMEALPLSLTELLKEEKAEARPSVLSKLSEMQNRPTAKSTARVSAEREL